MFKAFRLDGKPDDTVGCGLRCVGEDYIQEDGEVTTPHFDIIRVFPRQTSYTPDDDMAFIGMPTLFIP